MKSNAVLVAILAATFTVSGCGKNSEVPTPSTAAAKSSSSNARSCSDIARVTDERELAEMKNRCGLGSQSFTPSKAKGY